MLWLIYTDSHRAGKQKQLYSYNMRPPPGCDETLFGYVLPIFVQ